MSKTRLNYQAPVSVEIVTDYFGILCGSYGKDNSLGGYVDEVTPSYGEDD